MKLYNFFRSGTSHRLRIALNLKGQAYEQVAVDLRKEEHLSAAYAAINPQQLVPALGWLIPVPFYFLELLVGLVQALVFMLLTSVFTLLICEHEDDGHGHGEKAHH